MDRILGSWGETRTVPLVCSLPSLCQRPPTHLRAFTLVHVHHVLLASSSSSSSSSFFFLSWFSVSSPFSQSLFTRSAVTSTSQHFLCVSSCPRRAAKSHKCVTEAAHGYLLQDYWGRMGLFPLGGNVARTYFWWRDMKERHRFEDIGINQNMILKMIL